MKLSGNFRPCIVSAQDQSRIVSPADSSLHELQVEEAGGTEMNQHRQRRILMQISTMYDPKC